MEYKINLRGLFIFETKSLIGRIFFNRKPRLYDGKNYLNLGCGPSYTQGYIHADFFNRFKFWKKNIPKLEWQLDLRYPLNCKDEVFDGIFTEHTLEHLYPSHVKALLKELHRTLKTNSIIRITVPDIEKYIMFYNRIYDGYDVEDFKKKYKTGCSAIRGVTQNFLHFSTWDFEELKIYLKEAGFKNVKKMSFGVTQDSNLKLDRKSRSYESLYIEAMK